MGICNVPIAAWPIRGTVSVTGPRRRRSLASKRVLLWTAGGGQSTA